MSRTCLLTKNKNTFIVLILDYDVFINNNREKKSLSMDYQLIFRRKKINFKNL